MRHCKGKLIKMYFFNTLKRKNLTKTERFCSSKACDGGIILQECNVWMEICHIANTQSGTITCSDCEHQNNYSLSFVVILPTVQWRTLMREWDCCNTLHHSWAIKQEQLREHPPCLWYIYSMPVPKRQENEKSTTLQHYS